VRTYGFCAINLVDRRASVAYGKKQLRVNSQASSFIAPIHHYSLGLCQKENLHRTARGIKINEGKNKKQVKDDIVLKRIPRNAPLIKGFTKILWTNSQYSRF
jgi:hypothetical protein